MWIKWKEQCFVIQNWIVQSLKKKIRAKCWYSYSAQFLHHHRDTKRDSSASRDNSRNQVTQYKYSEQSLRLPLVLSGTFQVRDKRWANREVKHSKIRWLFLPQDLMGYWYLDRVTQLYWSLGKILHLGSLWRELSNPVKPWAQSSSSPSMVHMGHERYSAVEDCASMPLDGTGSNVNAAVQPFASFKFGT